MNKFEKALVFAYKAHNGQFRKYTNEPYVCHPITVSNILKLYNYSEDVQIAALFHDIIENTTIVISEIEDLFGENIAKLVLEVTDISELSNGNRATRKAIDREHIKNASPNGQAIKLADLIDNTRTIVMYDKNFAKVYLKEKATVLNIIDKNKCNLSLYSKALLVFNDAYNTLMFAQKYKKV